MTKQEMIKSITKNLKKLDDKKLAAWELFFRPDSVCACKNDGYNSPYYMVFESRKEMNEYLGVEKNECDCDEPCDCDCYDEGDGFPEDWSDDSPCIMTKPLP